MVLLRARMAAFGSAFDVNGYTRRLTMSIPVGPCVPPLSPHTIGSIRGRLGRPYAQRRRRMHLKLLYATVIGLAGVVVALAATNPVLHLRGDRFKPLTYDEMTPEQKTMVDHIMATGRP